VVATEAGAQSQKQEEKTTRRKRGAKKDLKEAIFTL